MSTLAIRDLTIIDGTGAQPYHGSVNVENGVITAVGSEVPPLPGAQVIEGRERFLIPGLWETHAHVCERGGAGRRPWYGIPPDGPALIEHNLATYLRYGITTVVDMGGRADVLMRARSDQQEGKFRGSRLLIAGGHFNWPSGAFQSPWMNRLVGTVAEARLEVDRALQEERIDIVKAVFSHGRYAWPPAPKMSPEVLAVLVERGHEHGVPVAIHANAVDDLVDAVALGVDSPEHMFHPVGPRWREDRTRVIDGCLAIGAFWSLTITLAEMMAHARDVEWLHSRLDEVPADLVDEAEHDPTSLWLNLSDEERDQAKERYEAALETAAETHRAGVRMTIGTDAGASAILHGFSTHREMELHSEAGVPNLDVLTMATRFAAEKLRVADRLGTIGVGKIADLVLLRQSPIESMRNAREIDAVIQGGEVVVPENVTEGEAV
jgi:imidazolonepropionase-like amidohydrolase